MSKILNPNYWSRNVARAHGTADHIVHEHRCYVIKFEHSFELPVSQNHSGSAKSYGCGDHANPVISRFQTLIWAFAQNPNGSVCYLRVFHAIIVMNMRYFAIVSSIFCYGLYVECKYLINIEFYLFSLSFPRDEAFVDTV